MEPLLEHVAEGRNSRILKEGLFIFSFCLYVCRLMQVTFFSLGTHRGLNLLKRLAGNKMGNKQNPHSVNCTQDMSVLYLTTLPFYKPRQAKYQPEKA